MTETNRWRSRGARIKQRSDLRRMRPAIEQLESRWLMSADDAVAAIADVQPDPVAAPAMLLPSGNANTTAESLLAAGGPGDPIQPGFNNIARSGDNGSVIYLGAGWVLTANHVALTSTITFAGQAYPVDMSSVTRLANSDGSNTDLKMFKVQGDPPLPEIFSSYIASAPASGHVFMVGNGYASDGEHFWSVNKSTTPWIWTEISEPSNPTYSNYAGVTTTGPRVVRWGENVVNDSNLYMPIGGVNVAGFTTRFDDLAYTRQAGLANEAQAASGDSGGAVFSLENGRWVLSGVMLAVSGSLSGQPSNTAVYGGITFVADLSAYRSQILAIAGVVNRQLVYNNSAYDGNTPGVGGNEDAAIATDKIAYLPGSGISTFDNVSSYSRGINSVVIDIASVHGTLTAADFRFRVGTNADLGTWKEAPSPSLITVRPGAGAGGSDRVQIIWPDSVIFGTWVEITVKGNDATGGFNANTGLAHSDLFYFAHRPGDTGGNTTTAAITSIYDELGARNNTAINQPIDNVYDFDKNKIVSLADQLVSRLSSGLLLMIDLPATTTALSLSDDESLATTGDLIELPPTDELVGPLPSSPRAEVFAKIDDHLHPLSGLFSSSPLFTGFLRRPKR